MAFAADGKKDNHQNLMHPKSSEVRFISESEKVSKQNINQQTK